jgi:hypothetical protein
MKNPLLNGVLSVMGEGTRTHEDQSPMKGNVHRYFLEVFDVYQSQWYE